MIQAWTLSNYCQLKKKGEKRALWWWCMTKWIKWNIENQRMETDSEFYWEPSWSCHDGCMNIRQHGTVKKIYNVYIIKGMYLVDYKIGSIQYSHAMDIALILLYLHWRYNQIIITNSDIIKSCSYHLYFFTYK